MKRAYLLMIPLFAIFLVTILGTQSVWSKGHVPLDHSQVCHDGVVKQVVDSALKGHLAHGDCRLPVCDSNNVFMAGDDCSGIVDNSGNGFCDTGLATRIPAEGVTPACTNPW